jgi:hypothetical protein
MDARTQLGVALAWGIIFAVICLWFFWKNRPILKPGFVVRHAMLNLFVYAGCLCFLYGGQITTFIFGKPVLYKHSPQLTAALLVWFGCIFFCFLMAALVLGRNRSAEFRLWLQTFKLSKWFLR